jgi:selenocysteine-specific elongation factor
VTTIAGGVIAEPTPPKRKRVTADEREALATALAGTPNAVIATCVERFGQHGVPAARLPVLSGLPEPTVSQALSDTDTFLDLDGLIVSRHVANNYRDSILASVDRHHLTEPLSAGASHDELRRETMPGAPSALFGWAIQTLVQHGGIITEGGHVRRTGFAPNLSPDQQRVTERLIHAFNQAGLTPPTLAELPSELRSRSDFDRLFRYLERRGDLVSLGQGQWMGRPALEDAVRRLRTHLDPGQTLTPADFRQLFGITRKYLIPLLEYLDRVGVTVRRGDLREVTPASQKALGPIP